MRRTNNNTHRANAGLHSVSESNLHPACPSLQKNKKISLNKKNFPLTHNTGQHAAGKKGSERGDRGSSKVTGVFVCVCVWGGVTNWRVSSFH